MSILYTGEVIGAIIGGLLAIVFVVFWFFFRSRLGEQITLKLVAYKYDLIKHREHYQFSIINSGFDIIRNAKLELHAKRRIIRKQQLSKDWYLKIEREDPISSRYESTTIRSHPIWNKDGYHVGWIIYLEIPYINPKRKNKNEQIVLDIYFDHEFNFSTTGSGEGWYSKYKDFRILTRLRKPILISSFLLLLSSIISALIYKQADLEYYETFIVLMILGISLLFALFLLFIIVLIILLIAFRKNDRKRDQIMRIADIFLF